MHSVPTTVIVFFAVVITVKPVGKTSAQYVWLPIANGAGNWLLGMLMIQGVSPEHIPLHTLSTSMYRQLDAIFVDVIVKFIVCPYADTIGTAFTDAFPQSCEQFIESSPESHIWFPQLF